VRRWSLPLSVALFGASLFFFYRCVISIASRDYVGAILLMFIGFAVIRGGSEMARLALQSELRR